MHSIQDITCLQLFHANSTKSWTSYFTKFGTHSQFIDDILIVTKGTYQQHMEKVEEVIDEAGIRLKLERCKMAQTKTKWLGYRLSESGVKPIDEKI